MEDIRAEVERLKEGLRDVGGIEDEILEYLREEEKKLRDPEEMNDEILRRLSMEELEKEIENIKNFIVSEEKLRNTKDTQDTTQTPTPDQQPVIQQPQQSMLQRVQCAASEMGSNLQQEGPRL